MAKIGPAGAQPSQRADVELKLPADSAYVSVLRTTTAALAARMDFPIDDIEDLRIAVGEASAMVLPEADTAGDLVARFFMNPGRLRVTVGVTVTRDDAEPDYDSFAWQVLATLATTAEAVTVDGTFSITLTMDSSHPEAGL